jgi:hypothetical protein
MPAKVDKAHLRSTQCQSSVRCKLEISDALVVIVVLASGYVNAWHLDRQRSAISPDHHTLNKTLEILKKLQGFAVNLLRLEGKLF